MRTPLLIALLLCISAPLATLVGQNVESKQKRAHGLAPTHKDLVYSSPDGQDLLLDLYVPEGDGPFPVVVWIHGGGWKNGSKAKTKAKFLPAYGIAVASIQYRLTDQAQWPAQINDCRAAIAWLRANGAMYGLKTKSIGAWGSSAGGHLAALVGTSPAPENQQVQAVCDWFGPSDLLTMPPNNVGDGRTAEEVANSNGAKLLGATVLDVPELAKQASAFYQVSKNDPPFLIMHGTADPNVPVSQSEKLHTALLKAGVDSTLRLIPGAAHGGPKFQTPEVETEVVAFFRKHLE